MTSPHRRAIHHINVLPYIDVMLVLLIIFMATLPVLQHGTVPLPPVGHHTQAVPLAPLIIEMRPNHVLTLIDHGKRHAVENRQQLLERVKAILAQQASRPVVIAGDKALVYEDVVTMMDALKQAHVAQLGLLVEGKTRVARP